MPRTKYPETLYHVTKSSNLPSILSEGLVPRLDLKLGANDAKKATVVNLTDIDLLDFIYRKAKEYHKTSDLVVLEIDARNLPLRRRRAFAWDDYFPYGGDEIEWYTTSSIISPDRIIGVHRGMFIEDSFLGFGP